jgi:four helix bundle protein
LPSFVGNIVGSFVDRFGLVLFSREMLTHHKLKVYEKALAFGACAEELSAPWGRRHAITEHFRRAAESIVLNIAEAARLLSGPDKANTLDYALGSALECAACLDIASIKRRLSPERSLTEKKRLLEVARMLVGLRKAWLQSEMSEEHSSYQTEPSVSGVAVLFHHESLYVYQVGLDFIRWFVGLPGGGELSDRLCREVDKSATSLVLNVAEGNGRYSELDHRRFLEIAAGSAVKAAAYLDLYEQKNLPARRESMQGRELLSRVIAMLNRF